MSLLWRYHSAGGTNVPSTVKEENTVVDGKTVKVKKTTKK